MILGHGEKRSRSLTACSLVGTCGKTPLSVKITLKIFEKFPTASEECEGDISALRQNAKMDTPVLRHHRS